VGKKVAGLKNRVCIGGKGGKKSNTGHTGGLDRANVGLILGISENG